MENLLNKLREHKIWKMIANEKNKGLYSSQDNIFKNAIIESRNGEMFVSTIEISGKANFNTKEYEHGTRQYRISEIGNLKNNPKNIERITFLIDGKDYEFVRCENGE